MRKLPPLVSLRAFEAAARLGSFRAAAEELHVTPSAVSHHIKALEQYFGGALFFRHPQSVGLTMTGRKLLSTTAVAFDLLEEVTRDIDASANMEPIKVVAQPLIASKWVINRLQEFSANYPGIDLRLHSYSDPLELTEFEADIYILWGSGTWSGFVSEQLIKAAYVPIVNTRLERAVRRIDSVEDLVDFNLLHERNHRRWEQWLRSMDSSSVDYRSGIIIDDALVLFQSALTGRGVVLAPLPLVSGDVDSGDIRMPFNIAIQPSDQYYLVARSGTLDNANVRHVWNWLLKEAQQAEETGFRDKGLVVVPVE